MHHVVVRASGQTVPSARTGHGSFVEASSVSEGSVWPQGLSWSDTESRLASNRVASGAVAVRLRSGPRSQECVAKTGCGIGGLGVSFQLRGPGNGVAKDPSSLWEVGVTGEQECGGKRKGPGVGSRSRSKPREGDRNQTAMAAKSCGSSPACWRSELVSRMRGWRASVGPSASSSCLLRRRPALGPENCFGTSGILAWWVRSTNPGSVGILAWWVR